MRKLVTQKKIFHFNPSLVLLLLAPGQQGIPFSNPSWCELTAIPGFSAHPFHQHALFLNTEPGFCLFFFYYRRR